MILVYDRRCNSTCLQLCEHVIGVPEYTIIWYKTPVETTQCRVFASNPVERVEISHCVKIDMGDPWPPDNLSKRSMYRWQCFTPAVFHIIVSFMNRMHWLVEVLRRTKYPIYRCWYRYSLYLTNLYALSTHIKQYSHMLGCSYIQFTKFQIVLDDFKRVSESSRVFQIVKTSYRNKMRIHTF